MCQAIWQAQDTKEEEAMDLLLQPRLCTPMGPPGGRRLTLPTSFPHLVLPPGQSSIFGTNKWRIISLKNSYGPQPLGCQCLFLEAAPKAGQE